MLRNSKGILDRGLGQGGHDLVSVSYTHLDVYKRQVKAIGDADDLPSVLEDGGFGGGANDSIEAGSVPASGADTDTANVSHRQFVVGR